jgi:NADP-dependent 3-hydroxy acid dehydrogenase YdfG
MIMEKVWLITGCSTGFGRELAKEVLAKGYKVAVASRKTSDVDDIVAAYPNTSIAIKLDVTIDSEIKSSVAQTMAHFGQIDVLVNNAGIGYFGSIEESEEVEVRKMFEINVFGLAKMTQEVLPHMRKQRSGHILNIASIAGHYGTVAKRIAERLIENNMVDLLGSDMHKTSHLEVYKRALKEPALHRLLASETLINSRL